MEIQHALLADYAEIVNGKLYLMGGGWDTYYVREVPTQVRIAVAIGVSLDWDETNQPFPVRATIEDDDGQVLARIEGTMQVGRPASLPAGSRQLSQMAVNLGLNFKTMGGYQLRVIAGEGEFARERTSAFRIAERKSN